MIGNRQLLEWLTPRRPLLYLFSGIIAGFVTYSLGYDLGVVSMSTGIAILGFMIYRQPGPDIAFYASHGRSDYPMPNPRFIRECLDRLHLIPEQVFIDPKFSKDERITAGVIAGCYRGSLIFPLVIAQGLLFNLPWYIVLPLGSLGLLFGVIYWFYGVRGPIFKGKESSNIGLLSELTSGVLIVWMNMIYPIVLGLMFKGDS